MKILEEIVIHELTQPVRFNSYCEAYIPFFESRKSVKKGIKKGVVLLNEVIMPGGTWLKIDDKITIVELQETPPKSYKLSIPIIFEDDHLAIVNKPAGLTVSGNQFKTLYNALGYNLAPSTQPNALPWPLPVHRLDNQTSGLVVIAKTKTARIALGHLFEKKTIVKTYQAIVMGRLGEKLKTKSIINHPIEGKEAITKIKILTESRSLKNDWLTLLQLSPLTGRTHQLRIHLANQGIPILGDKIYANETIKHKGLFLCAVGLKFSHPITAEKIDIEIGLPEKFTKRLKSEQKRWDNYNKC